MDGREKILFLQCWHIIHQCEILDKALVTCSDEIKRSDGVARSGNITQLIFFTKMTAGVLHEGWKAIQKAYHGSGLAKDYNDKLSDELRDNLKKLGKYFADSSNIVPTLRNKFSFHSDLERIEQGIDLVNDDDDFEIIFPMAGGRFYCGLASTMIDAAMLKSFNTADISDAVEKLYKEVAGDVFDWVTSFCHEFCAVICKNFDLEFSELGVESIKGEELVFPYFCKLSKD